jgi:protein-S-isoprenylcysteine O-methyltransferase Ste14
LDHLLSSIRHGRRGSELWLDVFLAFSVWSWAAGLFVRDEGPPFAIRLAVAALNGSVGLLFLLRSAPIAHGSNAAMVSAIPSIVLGGVALRVAPDLWPLGSTIAFAVATLFAIVALGFLGRSFSVLPVRRELVTKGPFGVLRHPAYASELVMVIAAGSARAWWVGLVLGALTFVSLVPRIRAEEAGLEGDEGWMRYAERVRFRLVPGVF